MELRGSLTAATPRGIFRSRAIYTGPRGFARSSHPSRHFFLMHIYTGTRGLARSSHPSRHFSLMRHLYWHSGARSQQPPLEEFFAHATSILALGVSLAATTLRGVFRSCDIYTGTRGLALSSHPS